MESKQIYIISPMQSVFVHVFHVCIYTSDGNMPYPQLFILITKDFA